MRRRMSARFRVGMMQVILILIFDFRISIFDCTLRWATGEHLAVSTTDFVDDTDDLAVGHHLAVGPPCCNEHEAAEDLPVGHLSS